MFISLIPILKFKYATKTRKTQYFLEKNSKKIIY